jgi:NAD(P)H-flavin reductase
VCALQPTFRRVTRVRRESADTVTLWIEPPPAYSFRPGQFNMLYAFAVGEVPISMSGDPARGGELVHTIRAVGAVSQALCRAKKGALLGVRGPYGQPWPLAEVAGSDLVLIAGGLGLAPLRPAIYQLVAQRAQYGDAALLVGARSPEGLLYPSELARWAKRRLRVLTTVDHADAAWRGHVGVVPALLADVAMGPRTAAFVCGPEVMMRFTVRELLARGVPEERIYLSLERNMKCAVGFCGHCQLGPSFVCKDGPVLRYDRIRSLFWQREA